MGMFTLILMFFYWTEVNLVTRRCMMTQASPCSVQQHFKIKLIKGFIAGTNKKATLFFFLVFNENKTKKASFGWTVVLEYQTVDYMNE